VAGAVDAVLGCISMIMALLSSRRHRYAIGQPPYPGSIGRGRHPTPRIRLAFLRLLMVTPSSSLFLLIRFHLSVSVVGDENVSIIR
jgi:hypothetical protein